MTELLGVDERPDHPIVDPQAPLGQLAYQPSQREVALPTALHQPLAIRANQLLRPPPAPRQRRQPTRLPVLANPVDRRLDPDPKPGRRLPPRQSLPLDRVHNTLAKVSRIRLSHPCWLLLPRFPVMGAELRREPRLRGRAIRRF